tara:strand:+ start:775 stop:1254 length:480 start_codon:yes stop_codon:yes gene_type:complete
MPNYNYFCSGCDLNYVDLRTYENRENPFTCEECGMKGCPLTYDMSRNAEGGTACGVINQTKGQVNYYDRTSVVSQEKQFMEGAVESTKEALKFEHGNSPYSRVKIPYEKLEKEGILGKVSEEDKQLRIKAAQNTVSEATKNMNKEDIERTINTNRNDAG